MSFIARNVFPPIPSLPRSYFLGHHKSGLIKMKQLLPSIDLVIDCRDYRVPLTSRNPLFEKALEEKERIIIYTKRDLGGGLRDEKNEELIRGWHGGSTVMFVRNGEEERQNRKAAGKVLQVLREHAEKNWKLVGHRVMVVGMPNVGKSTLLNALRSLGTGKGKAARTGAQPGVTRKFSSGVKIIPSEYEVKAGMGKRGVGGVGGGVYLLDTPGVFMPYVPDAEAMMKLALCGSVKDTIVPPVVLAEYLLYRINLVDPGLYAEYAPGPTNDIVELLELMARKTGRLGKYGAVDHEATSLWMIQKWRRGELGRFGLDKLDEESLARAKIEEEGMAPSMNQARKAERERRRARNIARGET